jgi:hypothetical protein
MLVGLHNRLQRHFNRLGSTLRSQDFLGSSHEPVIQPQRRQCFCHSFTSIGGVIRFINIVIPGQREMCRLARRIGTEIGIKLSA